MKSLIFLLLAVFSISFPISVITNSGEFYSGDIVEENDNYITIMGDAGVFEINKEEIKEKIITLDSNNPFIVKEYMKKKGIRFSYAAGLGELIPVKDVHTYSDGSTRDVCINQISEIGLFYYLDLPEKYSLEFGLGILNRIPNVSEKLARDEFVSSFVSVSLRKMIFRSLNGGYHFNVGMGMNFYTNSRMKAYDGNKDYKVKYKDTLGYHFIAELWSNMPKLWIFDDLNFVMSLRWNSGALFAVESVEEVGTGLVSSPYPEWNSVGMNGFTFNTSLAFLW